jgi:flagellar hook-associated protein 2
MGVTIDGIVSGLDTTALLEAYTTGFQATTRVLRSRQSELEVRRALLQDFKGLIDDLQTMLQDITSASDMAAMSGTSSNESALTVSVDDGAQVGSFAFDVLALAQSEMEISQGYAAESDSVGEGTITVTLGGVDTVAILSAADGTDTLAGAATAISEQVDGVSAYVMSDGSGLTPYRLVLVSDDTGAEQNIEISHALSGGSAPVFTEQISAADAEIELANQTIRGATNTFDQVIPGVTLQAGDLGQSTVTIARDNEATVERVLDFVDAYNAITSFVSAKTASSEDGDRSKLSGESVLGTVQLGMQSAISGTSGVGDVAGMGALGFKTLQSGQLSLDEEILGDVMASSPDDALAVLAGPGGVFETMGSSLEVVVDPDQGSIALRTETLHRQIESFQDKIEADELRLGRYEEAMRSQFINLEMTLAQLHSTGNVLTSLFAK